MNKLLLWTLFTIFMSFSISASAASFRCGRALVKVDESTNALIKKCGKPVRKYSSKETVSEHGHQKRIGVSNWVYERRGKKDMIVSIYSGTVVKIQVD
ncbi:MAG: DUF2845 domain-containing protein [Gammaproteobacteria bacterium]|nr:DUF2845 domain-containing protein [Gammaproteobacteria bacterium]